MKAYIYILHFDLPLAHAEHYCGCTTNIRARMARHAHGHGSNLTRVLKEQGITWRLGHLAYCSFADMRRLERSLKDLKNTPRHCDICNPDSAFRLPGTTPIDLGALNFPKDSPTIRLLTRNLELPAVMTVRYTSEAEPPETLLWVRDLMHKDKDALGFIPAGGKGGLNIIAPRGLIAIVSNNGQDVGYAAFTIKPDGRQVNIHQCCIADDARLCGHGRALVSNIAAKFPYADIVAKVRNDLAANHFWSQIGFTLTQTVRHKTSGNAINWYCLPAQEPTL